MRESETEGSETQENQKINVNTNKHLGLLNILFQLISFQTCGVETVIKKIPFFSSVEIRHDNCSVLALYLYMPTWVIPFISSR